MVNYLNFEKSLSEIEGKIRELKQLGKGGDGINISDEVGRLEIKVDKMLRETYVKLDPWQKTQVARHPKRPHFKDYLSHFIDDFIPLSGDRQFGEDNAIIGGLGSFRGHSVVILGHEKGHDTESRIHHNFGMARPEGYRKSIRLMDMAERFKLPVISLVDTPGAYPGVGAEERGQSEAIARCTEKCLNIEVPVLTCIVGEGGSGGAVAVAVGNKVLMMEHGIYSVISPEGCASILWRTNERAKDAAIALKVTADELQKLNVIDEIIPEPVGGAHRDPKMAMDLLANSLERTLIDLSDIPGDRLKALRREKFLAMGDIGIN